jgi:peroxiredoxin
VPAILAPALGTVLPVLELAVAVALIATPTARWGAVAAAGLLALFCSGITLALRRGVPTDCHCFGALHSRPVSSWALARTTALLALGGFVAVAGWRNAGTSATAWIATASGAELAALTGAIVLTLLGAAHVAFSYQLFKQNGRLFDRVERLERALDGDLAQPGIIPVGAPAPAFVLPDIDGETRALQDLLAAHAPLLLLFTDPNCGACDPLLPEISRRQSEALDGPAVVMISTGLTEHIRAKAQEHGLSRVLVAPDFELARSLGIAGMPGARLLDADGRLASPPAVGLERVSELLATTSGQPGGTPGLQVFHAGAEAS